MNTFNVGDQVICLIVTDALRVDLSDNYKAIFTSPCTVIKDAHIPYGYNYEIQSNTYGFLKVLVFTDQIVKVDTKNIDKVIDLTRI